MCIATSIANCTQDQNKPCDEIGSLSRDAKYVNDSNFPFSLFNVTVVDQVEQNMTENCTSYTMIDGFAIGKY